MSVPLYAFDQAFEGHISTHIGLKWDRDGLAMLIREKRGRGKGEIRRAVMRRRPGGPHVTKLRAHMGQAYSYRHELDDGPRPWALRPLVSTAKRMSMIRMRETDRSLPPLIWRHFELAPARTRASF